MAPGRVIAIAGDVAIVDVDGRLLRASALLEPGVVAGDWVVIAGGAILRRIDARTGAEMAAAVSIAGVAGKAEMKQREL